MPNRTHNLAIETSGRAGSVALGCGDDLLATVALPEPRRHRVQLMPIIDQLCRDHHVTPAQIGEVYVSTGPGSFTGLRIGITTAKMLALAGDVKLVGVPSLQVVAQNVADRDGVLVCANMKGDTVYAQRFDHGIAANEPRVDQLSQMLEGVTCVVGNPLPAIARTNITILDKQHAVADAAALWRLARKCAKAEQFTNPAELLPIYPRRSDAEQQWDERYGQGATIQTRSQS